MAEIGEVKHTRPPVVLAPDEDEGKNAGKWKEKGNQDRMYKKTRQKAAASNTLTSNWSISVQLVREAKRVGLALSEVTPAYPCSYLSWIGSNGSSPGKTSRKEETEGI